MTTALEITGATGPQASAYRTIEVVPSGGALGADIVGFDFARLDEAQVAEVRRAWLEHGVVRFRGPKITDEMQVAFTRRLGDFVYHPRQLAGEEGAHPEHPEILVIANADLSGRPAGTMGNAEARWHTDTYIVERPPAAAILRAVRLPASGGNTCFCSMYDVYDALPAHLRRVVDGRQIQLDTVYDGARRVRKGMAEPETADIRHWPGIRHPIVRTHGETGRNALYLGARANAAWIVGLPLDESDALLEDLWSRVERPEHHWTQVWSEDDIVMWDNRCTMHRRDSWAATEIRIMHRTTTMGEIPFFRS